MFDVFFEMLWFIQCFYEVLLKLSDCRNKINSNSIWNSRFYGLLKYDFYAFWASIAMTTHDWTHVIRKKITRKLNIKVISNLHADSIRAINISRVFFFCNLSTFTAPFEFLNVRRIKCMSFAWNDVETNNSKRRGFHHHLRFARILDMSYSQCF